ncbi:MAG: polysaccharide biosynthesis tyrosine autokinase [Rubrobacter sp.]|nr:polysaccharide biosynthesis tyrosine autokinase [Rubrobacter sp.]
MDAGFKQGAPARRFEDDYVISLRDVFRILWKRAWLIVLVAVLALGLAVGLSLWQTPQYQSSITILVGQERGLIGPTGDPNRLLTLSETIATAVASLPVAKGVDEKLGLQTSPEYLLAGVTAEPIEGTQFVQVTYTGSDPEQTRRIANAFGEVSTEKISNLSPDPDTLTATVFERATLPGAQISPNSLRNGLLAVLMGGAMGVGLAFLLEFLDERWRSPKEAEQAIGVPSLGLIPASPNTRGGKGGSRPDTAGLEQYRMLRTNALHLLAGSPSKVIMVTSPGPKEGKTTVCANLGTALAQAGKRTLIVDCDLRRPMIHKFFELNNSYGAVDAIVGGRDPHETWQEPAPGLWVMTAGPVPPNPAELLSSQDFAELLDGLRQEFDYVIVDSSPIELVADPAILASRMDGVLLVIDHQKTSKDAIQQSMRTLEIVGAKVLGTVMNKVKPPKGSYYGVYEYYDG